MATLAAEIDASVDEIVVTDPVQTLSDGDAIRIDDELIVVRGYLGAVAPQHVNVRRGVAGYRGSGPRPSSRIPDYTRWRVERGYGGSTAATHAGGTEIMAANDAFVAAEDLTTPSPFTSSGAGLPEQWTVDDDGGLVLAYEDTTGIVPAVKVTYVGDPTDYIPLLALGDGAMDEQVFTIDSSGDSDFSLRDGNTSTKWTDKTDGGFGQVAKIGQSSSFFGPASGNLSVSYGSGVTIANLGSALLQVLFSGAVLLPALPTSDPGVAGQLFTDGVTSASTPKALMVSGG
jgi:hypothetical protein